MTRDLSQKQLDARLAKYGITRNEFSLMGYYEVPTNQGNVSISAWNAGDRHRNQLAYLLNEQAKWNAKKVTP